MRDFLDEKVRLGLEHYRSRNEVDRKLMMDLREIFSSDFQVGDADEMGEGRFAYLRQADFAGRDPEKAGEGRQVEGETLQAEDKSGGTAGHVRGEGCGMLKMGHG